MVTSAENTLNENTPPLNVNANINGTPVSENPNSEIPSSSASTSRIYTSANTTNPTYSHRDSLFQFQEFATGSGRPPASSAFTKASEITHLIRHEFCGKPEELQAFIDDANLAMSVCPPRFIPQVFTEIVAHITKGARTDLQGRNFVEWEPLKEHLRRKYKYHYTFDQLCDQLSGITQKPNEKTEAYADRIRQLVWKAKEIAKTTGENLDYVEKVLERYALNRFKNHTLPEMSKFLRIKGVKTFDDAVLEALDEERISRTNVLKYCSRCKTNTHNTSECNRKPFSSNNNHGSSSNNVKTCAYCRIPGHSLSKCRKRAYNERMKKENTLNSSNSSLSVRAIYCRKPGHLVKNCFKLKNKNSQDEKRSSPQKSTFSPAESKNLGQKSDENVRKTINMIQRQTFKPMKTFVHLSSPFLKKDKIVFLVDTGAEVSVIPIELIQAKHLESLETQNYSESLQAIVGELPCLGTIFLPFQFGEEKYDFKFHVVRQCDVGTFDTGILGNNILQTVKADIINSSLTMKLTTLGIELPLFESPILETTTATISNLRQKRPVMVKPFKLSPSLIEVPSPESQTSSIAQLEVHSTFEPSPSDESLSQDSQDFQELNVYQSLDISQNSASHKEAFEFFEHLLTLPDAQIPFLLKGTLESSNPQIQSISLQNDYDERTLQVLSKLRLSHLTPAVRELFETLIDQYSDDFFLKSDPLPLFHNEFQHEIHLTVERPIFVKNYRFPVCHKEEVERQTQELLERGIIKPSKSPWNAPIWVGPKKLDASGETKWRLVIDYRRLNSITVEDRVPMPNIQEILDNIGNASIFSTLDLANGFHQIPVRECDQPKTAFSTHQAHFEFTRMPFGLKNAPATFSRMINTVFSDVINKFCFVYLDDIIVFSQDTPQYLDHLHEIFKRIHEHYLQIQPDKSEFLKTKIVYLGHVVSIQGIQPDPEKTKVLTDYPIPKNVKQIQRFLGLTGYYRKFILDHAKKAKPLMVYSRKMNLLFGQKPNKKALMNLLKP